MTNVGMGTALMLVAAIVASGCGSRSRSDRAGKFAVVAEVERVYAPSRAWDLLDHEQRTGISRSRFVHCEGSRFAKTNEQLAQVEVVAARAMTFPDLGTPSPRRGWRVTLRELIALNGGRPTAKLISLRLPLRVERLGGRWRWLMDASDVEEYRHPAGADAPGCPE